MMSPFMPLRLRYALMPLMPDKRACPRRAAMPHTLFACDTRVMFMFRVTARRHALPTINSVTMLICYAIFCSLIYAPRDFQQRDEARCAFASQRRQHGPDTVDVLRALSASQAYAHIIFE